MTNELNFCNTNDHLKKTIRIVIRMLQYDPAIFAYFTSSCISRLFLSGSDEVGIEKMHRHIFSKEKKQWRCKNEARRLEA
ncbi:MAG: hypothetical protein KGL19_13735, partial [Bacteroidota bacterium]|nr:hypothetical protein [Bacteroidota bacterium]